MIYVIGIMILFTHGLIAQVIGMYWANKRGYGPSKFEFIVSLTPLLNFFYLIKELK